MADRDDVARGQGRRARQTCVQNTSPRFRLLRLRIYFFSPQGKLGAESGRGQLQAVPRAAIRSRYVCATPADQGEAASLMPLRVPSAC
jgi:hypothetical protein